MTLWLLKPRDDLPVLDNPWTPSYDRVFGFVVRAESEEEARRMVTRSGETGAEVIRHPDAWLSNDYSICMELTPDGEANIILRDYGIA